MGTSVDPAYIERLQEDIIIACHRLEENGHESLVVTVSEEGHSICGSEKGKKFLLDRHEFIMDFIQYCQNTPPLIKIETDIAEESEIHVLKDGTQKNNPVEQKKTSRGINKAINKTESYNQATPGPVDASFSETGNFDTDTDDYDDTDNFDASFMSNLETENNSRTVDQVTEDAVNTAIGKEIVAVKEESPQHYTSEKSTHNLQQMPEARIVLAKIEEIISSSQKTGLRTNHSKLKMSKVGKKSNSGTPNCDICGKKLATWNGVRRHQIVFHQENWDHECDICGKKFKVQENLTRHKEIHGAPKHKCQVCNKAFTTISYLRKHRVVHNTGKSFICNECGKGFGNQQYLDKHKLLHSGLKQYKCEVCGKVCSCKSNLDKHMVQHTCIKPFVCERCGKTFAAKQHLDNHFRLHTGEKPFKCTFEGCNMAFRTYENHRKHMCYHSDSYPFICDICGQKFKERSCMRHHRKKHTTEYRWPCDYCSEKFSTLVRFKTHIVRFHVEKKDEVTARTNIKFWPCDTCSKVFGAKEDYAQHMNVHLGYKPFKCSVCDKGFSSKSNLLQHRKGHTKYNRLRCTFCSKTYSDPKRLKEHLLNRHDQEVNLDDIMAEASKDLPAATPETKVEEDDSEDGPVILSGRNYIEQPVSHLGSNNIEQSVPVSGRNNDEQLVPIMTKPVIHSIVTPLFSIPVSRLNVIRTEDQFFGQ